MQVVTTGNKYLKAFGDKIDPQQEKQTKQIKKMKQTGKISRVYFK